MVESNFITNLNKFLSTENRRKVFLYYVFSEISSSDIVKETQIPFSTVDRITQLLKAHNILLEKRGKDTREKNYTVNLDFWLEENLKFMGLDFLEKEQVKKMVNLINSSGFFALSYLFTNSEFVVRFFEDPLKIGDDLIFLTLMQLNESTKALASLPSYILISLQFSPCSKKLARDIENKYLSKDIFLINEEIKKQPYIKNMTITEDSLIEFEKNRVKLTDMLKGFYERKILKMSLGELTRIR